MMKLSHLASVAALLFAVSLTSANAKSLQVNGPDVHGFNQFGAAVSGKQVTSIKIRMRRDRAGAARHRHRTKVARGVSLRGVTPVLVAKTNEIVTACGSVVVSAIAGRSNKSNHPRGRAVDLQGNPACIYAHLHGWPGGYSTDYATAPGGKHVHVSYNPGGMEWGVRFVHRHGKTKFAARRHHVAHAL